MKEPVRKGWIWIIMFLILVGTVPIYFPQGSLGLVLWGFPLWAWVSLAFSVLLSAYLSWLCMTQWNLVEDEEGEERI